MYGYCVVSVYRVRMATECCISVLNVYDYCGCQCTCMTTVWCQCTECVRLLCGVSVQSVYGGTGNQGSVWGDVTGAQAMSLQLAADESIIKLTVGTSGSNVCAVNITSSYQNFCSLAATCSPSLIRRLACWVLSAAVVLGV